MSVLIASLEDAFGVFRSVVGDALKALPFDKQTDRDLETIRDLDTAVLQAIENLKKGVVKGLLFQDKSLELTAVLLDGETIGEIRENDDGYFAYYRRENETTGPFQRYAEAVQEFC